LTYPKNGFKVLSMPIIHPPKKADERRAWIKYQLEVRGYSFASIARELGVHRNAVQSATRCSYPKMEAAIAGKLGLTPEAIWPERYSSGVQITRKRRGRQ
jgi:Ner family transcriptional regulator